MRRFTLRKISTTALVLAVGAALASATAHGQLIFVANSNNNTVGEYTTSGAVVNASLVSGLSDPYGIAVSGSDLFVTNQNTGTIGEYTTSGAVVNASLVSGLSDPFGVAVSGSDLFVTNYYNNTIGEYTTSGAVVNASLVSGLHSPFGIAVSGSHLFVVNNGSESIGEYTTSGAVVNASLVSGLSYPAGVVVVGSNLYVTNQTANTIGEYTTSGAVVNASLISGVSNPYGIATSGSDLFVTILGTDSIGEYTTSGAVVNAALISGLNNPQGLALSGTNLFVGNYSNGTIGEYTTSGGTVNPSLVSTNGPYFGLAVSGTDLFCANPGSGSISEFTTSGATVHSPLISGYAAARILVSGADLFVTGDWLGGLEEFTTSGGVVNASLDSGFGSALGIAELDSDLFIADGYDGTIGEYTTSGAVVNRSLVSGLNSPSGIALVNAVPEPATLTLLFAALLGLGAIYLRRRWAKATVQLLLAAALVAAAVAAQANVFKMGGTISGGTWTGDASLSFVTVGDAGNAADPSTGFGSVGYTYQMGKYDVTTAQYVQFLNAVAKNDSYGVFNADMATYYPTYCGVNIGISRSGSPGGYTYAVIGNGNLPAFDVSWGDAARFCNWLQNGQPTGAERPRTTESGAYNLGGATSQTALMAVTRSSSATYVIPTENEWYKAAFYEGGGTEAGYWLYPTQSNTAPSNVLSSTGTNNANFDDGTYTDPLGLLTPVGEFDESPGPYGTYDMGGDVFQWNEANFYGAYRGLRGGSYYYGSNYLDSVFRSHDDPSGDNAFYGFRVAVVPEPTSIALLLAGGLCLLAYAWRRRRQAAWVKV